MRRSVLLLSVLIFTNVVFAAEAWNESDPRQPGRGRLQGRAMVLQSSRALTDADRAELAKDGVFVRHVLTGGRYLARVADHATVTDARIASLEPLTAEMKIHRSARREVARATPWAQLNVIFHRDISFEDARAALLASGAALANPFATDFAPSHRIAVTVASESLDALASDERVLTIAGPRRFRIQADNASTAAMSHVTELHSAPYDLTGEGVTVSLFELAQAQLHNEFEGRLTTHATGGNVSDKSHATHVAGTIAAAGIRADAKGMAPKARVHQFCVTCGQGGLEWLEIKQDDLAPLGIVADNNSWGYILGWSSEGLPVWNDADVYYGAYDLIVGAPLDEISIEKDILFVHSAGNDGDAPQFGTWFEHYHVDDNGDPDISKTFCYSKNNSGTDCPASPCTGGCEKVRHHDTLPFDTIGVTAAAKNVVTVGAVVSPNASIVPFSSRGPAKDGRIKPDVVARGFSVLSTIPTNAYGRSSGTSMSSPAVTGIIALLTEQWRRTFGDANPTPAQLKALLIAGADDLGNPGPDYTYGFGLANAKSSVDAIIADGGQGRRIRNLTVSQGQSIEVPVVVTQQEKLRVVLQWPDPPIIFLGGDDIAAKALVNDLDVHVVDPSGNTVRAYILDKNTPDANATTGVNTVDNTEMVEIANAAPGTYRVVVTGTTVPEGPQEAVLVSSTRAASPCVDLQEINNSAETAHGNLVPGQQVSAGLCSAGDVDFFKFVATKTGPVSVTVTTGDTPVRVTLTGNGISRTQDVAANTTAVLSADANTVPNNVTVKFEAAGTLGAEPQYSFTPQFGETNQPRRRSVRN